MNSKIREALNAIPGAKARSAVAVEKAVGLQKLRGRVVTAARAPEDATDEQLVTLIAGSRAREAELESEANAINTRLREIYYEVSEYSPMLAKGNDSPSLVEWLREEVLSYKAQAGEVRA